MKNVPAAEKRKKAVSDETVNSSNAASPWLTVREAAARARVGVKTIYREANRKRLKAAQVDRRKALRFRREWIDEWLDQNATM